MVKINTLTLMVTFKCNIKCRHCGLTCSSGDNSWMTLEEMIELTRQADELGCLNVVLTGGEPTLMKHDNLLRYFSFVKEKTGIKIIRMVTNGLWAKSYERAYKLLKEWKEAGLDEINISCGEYHQEFVPIDNVVHAFNAGNDLKYLTVILAGEFIKGKQATITPYDFEKKMGRRIIQSTELSPFINRYTAFDCHPALNVGRGEEYIESESIPIKSYERIKGTCDNIINTLAFQPNGKVNACCGVMVRDHPILSLGNWRNESIIQILAKIHDDLILNWIRYLGVKDMKSWIHLKDSSIVFKEEYSSICDICNDLLTNDKCLSLLYKYGIDRKDEIVFQKVAKEATIFNMGYCYANK